MGHILEIPANRVLRHMLRPRQTLIQPMRVQVLPADDDSPVFTSPFYLANIGPADDPLLLDLRFAQTDHGFSIALLMTNERYPYDLTTIAGEILRRVQAQGITFDGVVAPESLGSKLSQEIARLCGDYTHHTTLQKGKPRTNEAGNVSVAAPKAWIGEDCGIAVSSGTSHPAAQQKLYLDPLIAEQLGALPNGVLIVDDARLSSGTVTSSIALLRQMNVPIAAVATVLNEHDPVSEVDGIPYIWLTKLPIFDRSANGWTARAGSYRGLPAFYVELA
jgi:adenine/guanine phosphoribosyltransferase-like PRPP-binding protein